jgi:hypothetical protein
LLRVERGRRPYELRNALPLRTHDGLRITCAVPHGVRPSLFWLDSAGQLTEVEDFHLAPGPAADRLTYPSPTEVFDLVGPPGTEFVLVCVGRAGPISRAEVTSALGDSRPWPRLPERVLLTVDREGVRAEAPGASRGIGAIRPGLLTGLLDPLDRLRTRLNGRVTFLAGVAFPHTDDMAEGRAAGLGTPAPTAGLP